MGHCQTNDNAPVEVSMEDVYNVEMEIINNNRLARKYIESYDDTVVALENLKRLEGLNVSDSGVYEVTMEALSDQFGYPNGVMLESETITSRIGTFAKKIWDGIVRALTAIRDWTRRLFGMTPIKSPEQIRKEEQDLQDEMVDNIVVDIRKNGDNKKSFTEAELKQQRRDEIKQNAKDARERHDAKWEAKRRNKVNDEYERKKRIRDKESAEYAESDAIEHGRAFAEALAEKKTRDALAAFRVIREKAEREGKPRPQRYSTEEREKLTAIRDKETARLAARTVKEIEEELEASNEQEIISNMYSYKFETARQVMLKLAIATCHAGTMWLPNKAMVRNTFTAQSLKWLKLLIKDRNSVTSSITIHGVSFNIVNDPVTHKDVDKSIYINVKEVDNHFDDHISQMGEVGQQIKLSQEWAKRISDLSEFITKYITEDHFKTTESQMNFGKAIVHEATYADSWARTISLALIKRDKVIKELTKDIPKRDINRLILSMFGPVK